jgi:hypothetical protein
VAAASGLLGDRAARFASQRVLGGADPSSTLAAVNARASDMVVRGDRAGALALLSDPRTVAAARVTGHLGGLHAALGILLGTTPVPAVSSGMGQDPYSAIIGAVATAVGQVAGAVPTTISAINQPKIQKQAGQVQEVIAQAQAQSAADTSAAWADSLAKSAPWVGGGILGLGLLALAVM